MNAETFNQVLDLIQMLAIIVGMILLHNSVPAGQITKLFDRLEANAKKTATTADDAVVSFGRLLSTLLTGQMPGPQPAPVTPDGLAPQAPPQTTTITATATSSPAPVVPLVASATASGQPHTEIYGAKTQLLDPDLDPNAAG